jgi:hypothetical protein
MLQQDGEMMMVMMVLVMMMIPLKSISMMVAMAMISPFREGISPTDFCLPESSFSLCFLSRRGGGIFLQWLP